MTDRKPAKRRKFAHEILGLIGISALVAVLIFLLATSVAAAVAETYCFENDVPMTELDWMEVDLWIFGLGAVLAVCLFCVLFLALLGDRLTYIRKITDGIDAMRAGETNAAIALEGNNELTELADAINYMSAARQQLLEKERTLARDKEQLIRSLSHDIRTPLTSILAYSEYLAEAEPLSAQERKRHLEMIRRKAQQIRELTDVLLEGGKRSPEYFDNARLLIEQLTAEFEESLEEGFTVRTDLSGCGPFAGRFDVQELRRIFDNLSSNVQKYAAPDCPVCLTVRLEDGGLVIRQTNAILPASDARDSYGIGITSVRRIAQHYAGTVSVQQENGIFAITVVFSSIL